MAKQAESSSSDFFGGFEAVMGDLAKKTGSGIPGDGDSPVDMSKRSISGENEKEYDIVEPEDAFKEEGNEDTQNEEEEEKETSKKDKPKEDDEEAPSEEEEETSSEEEESSSEENDSGKEEESEGSEEPAELGEAEEQDVVDFLNEKLQQELGWELEEDEKPKSVSDLVNFMQAIVEANSTPDFAGEEVQKLNDYVKNGGDLKEYMSEVYGGLDLDNVDLGNESNQKRLVTENFERLGYSKARINKLLERYEEAGTLEEEAEDALEVLKEYNSEKSEKLLEKQENFKVEQEKRQQKFFSDVQNNIEQLDSVRGIPISKSEKKELTEYIFKPDSDGMTKYQKDYAKDYKNLIESAYFTMKGDSFINKVERKATSQAARNLQDKLARKGKRTKNNATQGGGNQNSLNAWETVSSQLRRPSKLNF